MYIFRVIPFFCFCLLFSCSDDKEVAPDQTYQSILGRDENTSLTRDNLYRIRVPKQWKRLDSPLGESLQDTKKSLCEFFIEEDNEKIKIAIHNFPSRNMDDRIPPMAQISRWKRQFDTIDPVRQLTTPQSFSGFVGFLYEGDGTIEDKDNTIMGWTMQVGMEHYRILSGPDFPIQMRADITIKVTGPRDMISKHRDAIISFSRSFELIEEIPAG